MIDPSDIMGLIKNHCFACIICTKQSCYIHLNTHNLLMYSALRTSIIDEKVRRGLRHALIIEIDDTIKDILAYVILHEPVTLYNISKNTRYAISTVYKKAKRMLYYELIKPSLYWVDENGKRRQVYTATVKG